jgi:hypothetical protein
MIRKFGKVKARKDKRTLKLKTILSGLPAIPDNWIFDSVHRGIPTPVYGNDSCGDCVLAGRGHQTLRFEVLEQKKVVPISTSDVTKEYLAETGGVDVGLELLNSLKLWRSKGWLAAGKTYNIAAFASINRKNRDEVKAAIYLLAGIGVGLQLPVSAEEQINQRKTWDVVATGDSEKGSWGGHYVYVSGYSPRGLQCITWGQKQNMTWDFFNKYCDECFAIVDGLDKWKKGAPGIDVNGLMGYLDKLKK